MKHATQTASLMAVTLVLGACELLSGPGEPQQELASLPRALTAGEAAVIEARARRGHVGSVDDIAVRRGDADASDHAEVPH